MDSIIILHHDHNIGSAIKDMVKGVLLEPSSEGMTVQVQSLIDFQRMKEAKNEKFLIFLDETYVLSYSITDIEDILTGPQVVRILMSKNPATNRIVFVANNWRYDNIIITPICREELRDLIFFYLKECNHSLPES